MTSVTGQGYALVLSGGGVRATAFHLGILLRLAAEERLERVKVISTVSGGSLAAALVFSRAGLTWPSSRTFIDKVLPEARDALVEQSLQGNIVARTMLRPWKVLGSRGDLFALQRSAGTRPRGWLAGRARASARQVCRPHAGGHGASAPPDRKARRPLPYSAW
jgi:hypothetical protein